MRPSAAAPTLVALGLALAVAHHARAESDCQRAFERWAKHSSARIMPQSASGRGACVPTEAVRNDLLEGLNRARGICAEASSDQSQQETRTLLNINLSFIASLSVCPSSGTADAGGAGWATRSAPVAEKPKVAAPLPAPPAISPPAPPRVAVPAPPPAPPKPAVAAPRPAPSAPASPAPLPSPPCIEISPAQNGGFALVNRRCRGHTVLAVIETHGAAGVTVCKGYAINYTLGVRTPLAKPPRINYECVESQGPCNKGRLGDMFPECDW